MGSPAHPAQGDSVIDPRPGAELRALVDAARSGDHDALDDLVRATYGGTYTLAYRLTGNEDDARDVVQDAYLRAWKGLRRFRGDAQFTTWLYRITANCSANLMAKRARHRTETLSDDDPVIDVRPESDPELRLAASDERAEIAAALREMPLRLRQVIVLRDIYDLPHGAIAKELGITEAAAKVRLHRARKRLRDLLATDHAAGGPSRNTAVDPAQELSSGGAAVEPGLSSGHAAVEPGLSSGHAADDESEPRAHAG